MWSRAGYAAATAALAAAAGLAAARLGVGDTGAVAAGLAGAWALQVPAFWRLAGVLARGERALRPWIAGMALRLGGLGLLAVAGTATELPAADAALAYVGALMAFLGLEGVWLIRRQRGSGVATGRTREPDSGARDGGTDEAAGERPTTHR